MKLYDLKQGDKFRLKGDTRVFMFDKTEGMFSMCYDAKGALQHIIVTAEVKKVEDETKSDNRIRG